MLSIAFGLVKKMNQGNPSVDRALKIKSCNVPFIGGGRGLDVLSTLGLDKFHFGYTIRHIHTREIVLVEFICF